MSDSTSNAAGKLAEIFSGWRVEHEQLDATMLELFQWMNDPLHHPGPPYSLAAARLQALLTRLRVHFSHEETLGVMLAASHGGATQEINGVRQRGESEHQTLETRLQAIIDELRRRSEAGARVPAELAAQANVPASNVPCGDVDDGRTATKTHWGSIVEQFNLFYDLLEQHEEQEEQAVQWLRPSA